MVWPMFNGRLYRAAFVPFLFALGDRRVLAVGSAAPLGSTLAPDAFNGARPLAEAASALRPRFPAPPPGQPPATKRSPRVVAQPLGEPRRHRPAAASGAAPVRIQAQTIDGERTLTTVIARASRLDGLERRS